VKLLLDENIPHQLRLELLDHEVFTTTYMGWNGIKNGELLKLASGDGFSALISTDRGLEHQQNLDSLPLAIVLVPAPSNTIGSLRPWIPNLLSTLAALQSRTFVIVEAP